MVLVFFYSQKLCLTNQKKKCGYFVSFLNGKKTLLFLLLHFLLIKKLYYSLPQRVITPERPISSKEIWLFKKHLTFFFFFYLIKR
jgi:hypothetical protein